MNLYVVFCKSKNKYEKYIKINRIRNKVVIDIKQQLDENEIKIEEGKKYRDYFNLLIYTRILHALKKNKDIYYIPNFNNKNITLEQIMNIKNIVDYPNVNFNILLFYDEFKNDAIMEEILDNLDFFDVSQVIKDY